MNDRFLSLLRPVLTFLVALFPLLVNAQTPIDSLPPIDSLTDWQVNALAQQYTAQARDFEQILSEKSLAATSRRAAVEDSWKMAKADSTTAKPVLDSLAGLLKTVKNEEKTALRNQGQAAKTLEMADKTAAADNLTQRKNLVKLWKNLRQVQEMAYPAPPAPPADGQEPVAKEKKRPKKQTPKADMPKVESEDLPQAATPLMPDSLQESTQPPALKTPPARRSPPAKKYDPAADVMLHPPALPCAMAVQTRDEFSGEIYRRTVAAELFRQTPAALKSYLQGKPNVQCEAALAASGATAFLHLTFTINDPNPRKAFGKLDQNSQATLWFMDGTSFALFTKQTFEGVQNPENQSFVFQVQYPLTPEVLKKMRRMELDKLRIAWSSGYEDYDVQYVQLLMQQAACLFE